MQVEFENMAKFGGFALPFKVVTKPIQTKNWQGRVSTMGLIYKVMGTGDPKFQTGSRSSFSMVSVDYTTCEISNRR